MSSNNRRCRNCISWSDCKMLGMPADTIGCSEWESATHRFNSKKQ